LAGCSGGPYASLPDAPAEKLQAASGLWESYRTTLSDKATSRDEVALARHFCRPLVAATEPAEFLKRMSAAQKMTSTGLMDSIRLTALKQAPEGLLLIVESKAGQAAIPLCEEDGAPRLADLAAASGDWKAAPHHASAQMPEERSLLYLEVLVRDEQAPLAERLRAAVGLARKEWRSNLLKAQGRVTQPVVRLGLGLARTKVDGLDPSFIQNFPADPAGLRALLEADRALFEEMIVKLGNLGSAVEDPPANEKMFQVAAAAPQEIQATAARALYDMAELSPERFANGVRAQVKDLQADPALKLYFEELGRRGGSAPQLERFLKKFSKQGEPEERKLCRELLGRFPRTR
jgi:hypothetical protein